MTFGIRCGRGDRGDGAATLPDNASTETYLRIAQQAIAAGDRSRAETALSRAETNLLTSSYIAGSVTGPIRSPTIVVVRKARAAVMAGDYRDAGRLIAKVRREPKIERGVGADGSATHALGDSTNNGSPK